MNVVHTTQAFTPAASQAAAVVARAREITGLSQSELAEMLGCSQTLVSKYEHARAMPPADVIIHCIHIGGLGVLAPLIASRDGAQGWRNVTELLRLLEVAINSARQLTEENNN